MDFIHRIYTNYRDIANEKLRCIVRVVSLLERIDKKDIATQSGLPIKTVYLWHCGSQNFSDKRIRQMLDYITTTFAANLPIIEQMAETVFFCQRKMEENTHE